MAKQISLKAVKRPQVGRQNAKKTRTSGNIPAVIYGSHTEPTPIQLNDREVTKIFKIAKTGNLLVDLSLDDNGKTTNRLAFLQEVQRHPYKDHILHIDFHEIRADEKLHAHVSIVALGEPQGVKTGGGLLDQALRELNVECLPKDLPEEIVVDVSSLQIGENIHVSDLKVPANVTVLSRPDLSVFSVLAPTKEEVVAPVAAVATAEPELVKKKPEDGEAAPAADAKAEKKPAEKKPEKK